MVSTCSIHDTEKVDYNERMVLTYILQGITLGLSAAVTPGPLQAYLLSQTMKHGWKRTLPTTLAPLATDGPIIVLVLFLLTQTPDWFLNALQIAGGFFILYLAYGAYQTYKHPALLNEMAIETTSQSFLKAMVINFLNPGPYIFWSVLSGPILLEGWRHAPILGLSFLGSFYCSFVGLFVVLVLLFALARRSGPRVVRGLIGFSAFALCLFGVYQLWSGLMR
jgi:threonine/homoserine/homoserine lactone efflux protein